MKIQFVLHREHNPSQNAGMGKIGFHSETHTKHIKRTTLCGKMLSLPMLTVAGSTGF